ncbi:hypothetical protein SEVIR_3G060201v4 [Setaria viridis]
MVRDRRTANRESRLLERAPMQLNRLHSAIPLCILHISFIQLSCSIILSVLRDSCVCTWPRMPSPACRHTSSTAHVVFLGVTNTCKVCGRRLLDFFHFYSLASLLTLPTWPILRAVSSC